jgi:hypothetical protein
LIIEHRVKKDHNTSIRTTPKLPFDIFWQISSMGVAKKTRKFGAVRILFSVFPTFSI